MSLLDLGWREEFARHFNHENPFWIPARVAVTHRGRYLLYSAQGDLDAVLAGSLDERPVTGDWVAALPGAPGDLARIDRILPRQSVFRRKPPVSGGRKLITFEGETRIAGGATVEQIIATNMDLVFVVTALDGDYSLNRIRRYLILAQCSGAQVIVLLNKVDLGDPGPALSELSTAAMTLPVSAHTGEGLRHLEALVQPARTAALIGSSGVGKSSIINALLGESRQYVSPKSTSTGKGRHTTTRRELVPLLRGGFLLDTPGMREVQLWAEESDISDAFGFIEGLAFQCRFSDCRHASEPGCAVKAAIDTEELEEWVLNEYRRLTREVRYLDRRRKERQIALQRRRLR
jgi:ribosome biogenesis GTPase / thiamine phosphate phosphatase